MGDDPEPRTYIVTANVTVSIEASSDEEAARLVERHLDMDGPAGVPRSRDDLTVTWVEAE